MCAARKDYFIKKVYLFYLYPRVECRARCVGPMRLCVGSAEQRVSRVPRHQTRYSIDESGVAVCEVCRHANNLEPLLQHLQTR